MKINNKIVLLCSPNLGVLENWLPIFDLLKKSNTSIKIVCLFTKPSLAALIDPDSDLIKLSEGYIDEVVFPSYNYEWMMFDSLRKSNQANTIPYFARLLKKVENYFSKTSLKFLVNVIKKMCYFFLNIHYKKYRLNNIDIDLFLLDAKFLLIDIVDLHKGIPTYNNFLVSVFPRMVCFSLLHGVNIDLNKVALKYSQKKQIENNPNTYYYFYSRKDDDFYLKHYDINSNQKQIGVPRHNNNWMNHLIENQTKLSDKYFAKPFLLIISRPQSDFLPTDRKVKTMQDIKKLAIDKLGFNVVIKCHPKEKSFDVYDNVFGKGEYNKDWFYTNRHPYLLAKQSTLCVSLYSSLVTDFLLIGTPVIEYLNIKGIPFHDNQESYRDEFNNPVLDYRYFGLVLGADNYSDLENHAKTILSDKDAVLKKLRDKYYESFYGRNENSAKIIADDILNEIKNENSTS